MLKRISLTSPIFSLLPPRTSVPLNFEASSWSGFCDAMVVEPELALLGLLELAELALGLLLGLAELALGFEASDFIASEALDLDASDFAGSEALDFGGSEALEPDALEPDGGAALGAPEGGAEYWAIADDSISPLTAVVISSFFNIAVSF